MNETQARDAICQVGESLFARGYVHATAGNISVRLDDGFLITPTDACLGRLDPARLARVNHEGHPVSGDAPSKTLALHRHIYQAARRHDAHTTCVIHTHSSHCVARSLGLDAPELLPPLTPYFVMKVGHVPLLPYYRPGDAQAAQQAVQLIAHYGARGTPIRALMLPRLGPVVWHDDPWSAMALLEELEETARLSLLAPATVAPLRATEMEVLRTQFGARW